MALVSIVTGCFNEEDNVVELYERICRTFAENLTGYNFELIFIDNASTDKTVEIVKRMAAEDRRVKIFLNNRNFGPVRSG